MKKIVLTCSVLLTAAAYGAEAETPTSYMQNWAQWRGPLANGVAPLANPPTHWNENTNIKWKSKIPGESTATPIVWGEQIILVTAVKTDREVELPPPPAEAGKNPFKIQRPHHFYQFIVMSVDRRSGEVRWQQIAKEEVPHEGHHPDASFASASPTTDGKFIYVSFGSRGVFCYDLAGNPKWSRDLGKMTIFNYFGEGCSPVVHGDRLVVNWDHQAGSFITALDTATGETKWKVDRDENSSWATPLVVEFKGRTQVIVNGTKRTRSYDLRTGEVIWECGGQVLAAIPCPVSDGQLVFAMTGYTGNALYAIPLDSTGDITDTDKIAWKRKEPGTPYVPSPLLYDELLVFTASNRGLLSCLNAKTGEPLIDRKRLEGISNIYASPVGAADRIYFTSRDGNTVVIKRGGELEVLATNKLDDRFDASAAIVDSQIILRGNENLYCISAE
ncbi:MAG TPA: PQQ-binding-like beta-propeller repeat protein [Pirellulales bacterium]|nr:PQQ-binding-like beta-propeller repeat protein [Pirellulales bacterium]